MILSQHISEYQDNLLTKMAFRSDPYLSTNQYATEQLLWDMPGTTGSSLVNSRNSIGTSDLGTFSPSRKPAHTGFASTTLSTSNDFGSEYSTFGSTYGSAMFGSRNDRELQRPQSPTSGASVLPSSLSHSSSSGGLANMSLGYTHTSNSRPVTAVNGTNFSRNLSIGQHPSPSGTPGFASSSTSSYSASPFAPSQYSGQSQPVNLNSNFNLNSMKSTGFDDLSRNSFIKRAHDVKRLSNGPGMSGFGSSTFMRNNMFNSTNGSDGPLFDISDFPSLSSRNRLDNPISFANVLSQGPKGYGMGKDGARDIHNEFQMHHEDFPALPGTDGATSAGQLLNRQEDSNNLTRGFSLAFEKEKNRVVSGDSSGDRATPNSTSSLSSSLSNQLNYGHSSANTAGINAYFQSDSSASDRTLQGISSYRRGQLDNPARSSLAAFPPAQGPPEASEFFSSIVVPKPVYVPPSIVQDHFGLFGFLQYMKCLSGNQHLPLTSVGCDLQALGLVFNPLDATPKRFKGYPFLHSYISEACTAHICHLDVDVPAEYLVSITMPKDKITPPRVSRFSDDLLFYLFYGFPGDIMQYAAAMELYARDWRFHKEEKIWITRIPNQPPIEKTALYERGKYQYFDSHTWRKDAREMHVEYAKLDERATFPSSAVQLMPNFLQQLFN